MVSKSFAVAIVLAMAVSSASAAPQIFEGYDLYADGANWNPSPGGNHPNSDTAYSNYLASLVSYSVESFEYFNLYDNPTTVPFNGSGSTAPYTGTAYFTGGGYVDDGTVWTNYGVGITGTHFYYSFQTNITFSTPVSALGVYLADINTCNDQFQFITINNNQVSYDVAAGVPDVGVAFYAVRSDLMDPIKTVILNSDVGCDGFFVDQMVLGNVIPVDCKGDGFNKPQTAPFDKTKICHCAQPGKCKTLCIEPYDALNRVTVSQVGRDTFGACKSGRKML